MKKSEFEKVIGDLVGGNISVLLCYGKPVVGLLKEVQHDHLLLEVNESLLYITIPAIQAIKKNSKDPLESPVKTDKKSVVHFHDVLFSLHYQWITLNEFSEQPLRGVLCEIIETHVTLINYEEVLYVPLTTIQTVQKGHKISLNSLQSSRQPQISKSVTQNKQQIAEQHLKIPDLIGNVEEAVEIEISQINLNEKDDKIIVKTTNTDVKEKNSIPEEKSLDVRVKINERSTKEFNDDSNIRKKISLKEHIQEQNKITDSTTGPESAETISPIVKLEPLGTSKSGHDSTEGSKNELIDYSKETKGAIHLDEIRVLNNSSFRELLEMDSKDYQSEIVSNDIQSIEDIPSENERSSPITLAGEKLLPCIDCLRELPGKLPDVDSIKNDQQRTHQNSNDKKEISVYQKMSPEDQNAFLEKQYYALMKHAAKNSISNTEEYCDESSNASYKVGGSQTDSENGTVSIEKQYTALLKHAATMHRQIIYK